MRRWKTVPVVAAFAVVGMIACTDQDTGPSEESPSDPTTGASAAPSTSGRIVFQRYDPSIDGPVTYTVDPDGSDLRPLFEDGHSEMARWSPDGAEIHIFCCNDGMVAHLIDPDTGDLRTIDRTYPGRETFCGGAWSSDGSRLACEVYGVDDPRMTGIYSVRASDGGALTQITSNPRGYDTPGDYAPDGTRLVFLRVDADEHTRLFVVEVDGTAAHKISGRLVDELSPGRWSPTGEQILFAARRSLEHHKSVWVVNADGSSLHELAIDRACGGLWSDPEAVGCYSPAWSPDGTKIVYVRSTPEGEDEGIYVANADGSGSVRVTDDEDDQPDWGTPAV